MNFIANFFINKLVFDRGSKEFTKSVLKRTVWTFGLFAFGILLIATLNVFSIIAGIFFIGIGMFVAISVYEMVEDQLAKNK